MEIKDYIPLVFMLLAAIFIFLAVKKKEYAKWAMSSVIMSLLSCPLVLKDNSASIILITNVAYLVILTNKYYKLEK